MENVSKMHELCDILGLDFLQRVRAEIDSSVQDINSWITSDLSVETTVRLKDYVETLLKEKLERLNEVNKRGLAILSYWNALCVPFEGKKDFSILVFYLGVDSTDDITETNALSIEFIKRVEEEYHRLRGQLDLLVLKKKSRLEQILKTAHLPSSFDDKDTSDPVTTLMDIKIQTSKAKALASSRASIVTQVELLQHADEEINWYKASEKDGISLNDSRSTKARLLLKALPKMVGKLEAELVDRNAPFIFDGMDTTEILEAIKGATGMKKTVEGISAEKIVEKDEAGTSAAKSVEEDSATVVEATDEHMQVDTEQDRLHLLKFGQKAPRAPRRARQEWPQPPTAPDSASAESMMSGSTEGSDDSMKTDPNDSDYDPDKDPGQDV